MDDSAHAAASDPRADSDPNPAHLAALDGALELAEEARVLDLAHAIADPSRGDFVAALLCHELASCHRLMMRFGAMADHYLSHTSPTIDADRRQVGRDAIGFAAIAARLMARYHQGALALPKLRADGEGVIKRIVVDWGDDDDRGGGHGSGHDPEPAGGPKGGSAGGPPAGASAAAPPRRGRLKNGNPSGDYLAAPRCGAKTRAGCACRQPAMTNGRCRLHGGKSTGARTADGQRRTRTARLVHGRRTAAVIAARSAAATVGRRLAWMAGLAHAHTLSAGHGVDRSDSRSPLDDAIALSPKPTTGRVAERSRDIRGDSSQTCTDAEKEGERRSAGMNANSLNARRKRSAVAIRVHPRSSVAKNSPLRLKRNRTLSELTSSAVTPAKAGAHKHGPLEYGPRLSSG